MCAMPGLQKLSWNASAGQPGVPGGHPGGPAVLGMQAAISQQVYHHQQSYRQVGTGLARHAARGTSPETLTLIRNMYTTCLPLGSVNSGGMPTE